MDLDFLDRKCRVVGFAGYKILWVCMDLDLLVLHHLYPPLAPSLSTLGTIFIPLPVSFLEKRIEPFFWTKTKTRLSCPRYPSCGIVVAPCPFDP